MKAFFATLGILALLSMPGFSQSSEEVSGGDRRNLEDSKPVEPKQKKSSASFKERLIFGGNIGLQFGSYTYIDISPLIGYRITPKLIGGVGFTYRYVNYDAFIPSYGNYTIEDNQYGYRFFGRYFIIPQIFAHVEYEGLNLTSDLGLTLNPDGSISESRSRTWVNSAFIGGGLFQSAGNSAGIFVMALYNMIDCTEAYCPYPDRWLIRIGVTAGF